MRKPRTMSLMRSCGCFGIGAQHDCLPGPRLSRRAFAAGLLATGGAASLSGCSTNPATGRSTFTGFQSVEDDIRIGQQYHDQLLQEFGGAYEDARLQSYVDGLGRRIAAQTEYQQLPYRFTILNSPIVNAMATPGGNIYLTRGLLALAGSEAELAAVIGHELGHANARHTAERQGDNLLLGVLGLGLGIATGSQELASLAQAGGAILLQSYSREQELEADALGIRYMTRAGYNPEAMVEILAALGEQAQLEARMMGLPPGQVGEFSFLSSHPRSADRVRLAQQRVAQSMPANAIVNRDQYLLAIDGMLFGDDPSQGVTRGRQFLHPDLRFGFDVPAGFQVKNSPRQVVARHANGGLIIFDVAQGRSGSPMQALQRWVGNAQLQNAESVSVNGMDAATGLVTVSNQQSPFIARPMVIRRDASSVFRFLFAAPPRTYRQWEREFRDTAYSFRRLSAQEAAAVRPTRLRVVPASSTTPQRAAQGFPYGEFSDDWLYLLNDLRPGQWPSGGQPVKTVV